MENQKGADSRRARVRRPRSLDGRRRFYEKGEGKQITAVRIFQGNSCGFTERVCRNPAVAYGHSGIFRECDPVADPVTDPVLRHFYEYLSIAEAFQSAFPVILIGIKGRRTESIVHW